MPPMRVLVTGSSGQVGSYAVEHFSSHGHDVVGVDLRPSRWTKQVQDVRGLKSLFDCEGVIHLAAQVSVPRSVEDPRFDAAHNLDGTLSMLELARRHDAKRFVFISSSAVYGPATRMPITEDTPSRPMSPYGLSKRVGEDYVRMYGALYGLQAVVLRPFNIFSVRQDPSNPYSGVMSKFVTSISRGLSPHIFGDGHQTRDFVHVSDIIQALDLALTHPKASGGAFNVGTGNAITIDALARLVLDLMGAKQLPTFGPPREGDIRDSVADIGALRALGYAPKTDLRTHVRELIPPRLGVQGGPASDLPSGPPKQIK